MYSLTKIPQLTEDKEVNDLLKMTKFKAEPRLLSCPDSALPTAASCLLSLYIVTYSLNMWHQNI